MDEVEDEKWVVGGVTMSMEMSAVEGIKISCCCLRCMSFIRFYCGGGCLAGGENRAGEGEVRSME